MDEAWTLQDLIGLLPKRVLDLDDFIRCAAVCEVWKCSFVEYKPQQEPWLMQVEREDSDVRDFYDYFNGKSLSFSLPEVHERWFFPTAFGWLFTIGLDLAIHLVHPLSKIRIPLPPADKFTSKAMLHDKTWMRSTFIENVCLSSDPREKDCVVMVTYSGVRNIAFARIGNSSWTDVELPRPCFYDFMFLDGRFYAIRKEGTVVVCDIELSKPKATIVVDELPRKPDDGKSWDTWPTYMVESDGNILVVLRETSGTWNHDKLDDNSENDDDSTQLAELVEYHTNSFEVYKLQKNENGEMECSRVMDLGDCALFLGRNSSMSVSTKNNNAIRRNCIYFTDDSPGFLELVKPEHGYDQGIYCLDDGKIEKCFKSLSHSSYTSPGWLQFSSFRIF